ncbi:MAG TPA: helix-turn-helix transcriptional regulator [Candidatus Angelobacter sp.]|nr:helix-turn-helix transcriptional regulator [Candidatus Angelobacter sp.]
MTGRELRQAREKKGWTQEEAAPRLGLSQSYLSMLEKDKRAVPKARLEQVLNVYDYVLSPLELPLQGEESWGELGNQEVAEQLAGLGYPGFSYMRSKATWNPAELLVAALTKDELESRLTEALPWLVLKFNAMEWSWVVLQVKMHDSQNRLGFVLTLATTLAEHMGKSAVSQQLSNVAEGLMPSVLLRELTLCHEHMPQAERRWLKEHSTPEAKQWNVLSDLSSEHLSHAVVN